MDDRHANLRKLDMLMAVIRLYIFKYVAGTETQRWFHLLYLSGIHELSAIFQLMSSVRNLYPVIGYVRAKGVFKLPPNSRNVREPAGLGNVPNFAGIQESTAKDTAPIFAYRLALT
jgi:hypothetical protein